MELDLSYRASFVGGTVFSVLPNIPPESYIITVLMAVIGAVVSFFISFFLRKIFNKK
jgi:uncharacterized membrane protein YeaQ/YmgE (transglycosylase-associated protein family)